MFILVGIIILIIFTFMGFFIWAASDIPLALRELTINSRQAKVRGSAYALLKILSLLIKILAVFTWICGIIISYAVAYVLIPGNLSTFFMTISSLFLPGA